MFIVTECEGWSILNRAKVSTLRSIRANGKGYARVGSIHSICVGRDFKHGIICRVYVFARSFVSVEDLSLEDFHDLGYSSKAEYMEQPYNRRNPSPDRVRYDFITLETIRETASNIGVVPEIFRGVINE